MDQNPKKQDNYRHQDVLTKLESLKNTSKHLQNYTSLIFSKTPQPIIETILNLKNELDNTTKFKTDPSLVKLSQLLCKLETLSHELERLSQTQSHSYGFSLKAMISRQKLYYKVSQVGCEIEEQVQAYMDRECVISLVRTLDQTHDEEEKMNVLGEFKSRVSRGFDRGFQDLVLKAKVFSKLESTLCDENCSKRVREECAEVIISLVHFNRNVFVGLILMGPTIEVLISIGSFSSIQSLTSLVSLIRSPLIDEIEAHGEIPRIVGLLSSHDLSTQISAFNCICEIGYYARKEVVWGILEQGLIEKLVQLQRAKVGNGKSNCGGCGAFFDGCVARFAVQVEVGEGLTQKEKAEFKAEVLKRVKEVCVSDVEVASISAEVLWGSSA